jgi:hypothetical protein
MPTAIVVQIMMENHLHFVNIGIALLPPILVLPNGEK